jgi:hypothetical protein
LFCQDYGINRDSMDDDEDDDYNMADGFSCGLCEQCPPMPLADYLLHLGITHRKLYDYLPEDWRQLLDC